MKFSRVAVRIALATVVMFAGGTAMAIILAKGDPAQKLRKDIDKQTAKFAICVGKASLKCEAAGTSGNAECDITGDGLPMPGTVPPEAITELADDIAKCTSKLNLSKKGTDYTGIGCPGDCDTGTVGDQACANMAAYQTASSAATKVQIELLGGILQAACAGDNTCFLTQGDLGVKYAKALFKRINKCENDYKDKKGNGGDNDTLANCDPATSTDTNFQGCVSGALGKAPGIIPMFADGLNTAVSDGRDDLYNENDCP